MKKRRPGDAAREARWRAWMAAAQDGDREAYERLLHELLPAVRAFVGRRLADPTAAEDVVQITLLSIHRARHTWRPERAFGPWWRAVARNAVIDHARARGRRPLEVPLDGLELASREERHLEREPLSAELAQALAELPPRQRQAVELLHVEGLSVAEAAHRVGATPGALKVRAHRGYQALRLRLGKEAR